MSASEGVGLLGVLPLPPTTIPLVSAMGNLAGPPGYIDNMIEPGLLHLSLDEGLAWMSSTSPTEILLQLLALGFNTAALPEVPSQEGEPGSPQEPSHNAPASVFETADDAPVSPSKISADTSLATTYSCNNFEHLLHFYYIICEACTPFVLLALLHFSEYL